MKILNTTSTTPTPRESLLGRKIQIELDGLDFAILRALIGSATIPESVVISKHLQTMHDVLQRAVSNEEYRESMCLVDYQTGAGLTYNL